jgi:hypothetical protein
MMEQPPALPEISRQDVLAYYLSQPGLIAGSFKETAQVMGDWSHRHNTARLRSQTGMRDS